MKEEGLLCDSWRASGAKYREAHRRASERHRETALKDEVGPPGPPKRAALLGVERANSFLSCGNLLFVPIGLARPPNPHIGSASRSAGLAIPAKKRDIGPAIRYKKRKSTASRSQCGAVLQPLHNRHWQCAPAEHVLEAPSPNRMAPDGGRIT